MNAARVDREERSESPSSHSRTMPTPDRPRPLMDLAQVAARLGVTQRHVRRLVAERRVPYLKWGHLLRFDPDEIEAWLDAARVRPGRPTR